MFAQLLLLFILIPLADLVLLWVISGYTGWATTILVVVLSGILGAYLASKQTKSVKSQIRERLMQNQMPADLLTDGAMILFAAGLLITPGLLTDIFGLSLLIPGMRKWYKRRASRWLKEQFQVRVMSSTSFQKDSDIVDGEVVADSSDADEDFEKTYPPVKPRAIQGELLE